MLTTNNYIEAYVMPLCNPVGCVHFLIFISLLLIAKIQKISQLLMLFNYAGIIRTSLTYVCLMFGTPSYILCQKLC